MRPEEKRARAEERPPKENEGTGKRREVLGGPHAEGLGRSRDARLSGEGSLLEKPKGIGYSGSVPTIREGAWRLVIIPGDHDPRHVHAMFGKDGPEVVVRLGKNGEVTPTRVDRPLTNADVRKALAAVQKHFDALAALWEAYSNG
jgi:hypothetical protein